MGRPLAFVEDTAVPPESLVSYVEEFSEVLQRHGLDAGFYGHASVGCLHVRPFVDLRVPGADQVMKSVAEEISSLVQRYGGVNSSEHGDGLARSQFNREQFGAELYGAMREIKQLFDPESRLNPGKIVDAPDMTLNLRDAVAAPKPFDTRLSFAKHGGMWEAADRCQNIGMCRKEASGVMCPSYMATRDEQHSTRGRANALAMALADPDPASALAGERLHEILDLCLECKACKSECPLAVDVASMKSEALYRYHDVHGTPLRDRVFGRIRAVNRFGSLLAPVSNWVVRPKSVRVILDRALGISRHRTLPTFHSDTVLRRRYRVGRMRERSAPRGDLVLLTDCFTTYSEPSIGKAAVKLLESAGWRVLFSGSQCCGRATLSKGLLEQAQRMASKMVDLLEPYASQGVPIVGLEPSCLLMLRDDYATLLPEDERVAVVADSAVLVADVLLKAIDDGDLVLHEDSEFKGRRIVFHGHCHEKAIVGTAASHALLERIPGANVNEVDAGCCGMAGSFGFESEHFDLSLSIGALRLFPMIEDERDSTEISASGVSCRAQIAQGTRRRARHPVELVERAIAR